MLLVLLIAAGCSGSDTPEANVKCNPRSLPADVTPSDTKEDELERHGIYRIVPADFAGELCYEDLYETSRDPGVSSTDPEVVRTSPLFVDPERIPAEFTLSTLDTFDGGLNTVVRQVYRIEDRDEKIEITRVRKSIDPIDIHAPPQTEGTSIADVLQGETVPTLEMSLQRIDGHEAVIFSPREELPEQFRMAIVMFYQDGLNTTLIGFRVSVALLTDIAEEIADRGAER